MCVADVNRNQTRLKRVPSFHTVLPEWAGVLKRKGLLLSASLCNWAERAPPVGVLILINIFSSRMGSKQICRRKLEFTVRAVKIYPSMTGKIKRPLAKRLETIFASSSSEKSEITFEWHVVKLEMMQPTSMSVLINLSSKFHSL